MSSELTTINKMTSMEIAEATGKLHHHIMRDIKDEVEKLENAGVDTQTKFGLSERQDATGRTIPYYELTKEGVLQLAARYDAVVRAKLIELAMKHEQAISPYQGLSPELQAIFITDRKVQVIESRVEKLENTMTIDYTQQEQLRELANKTVINALGGKTSRAYHMIGGKVFAEMWRHYKRSMQVNSYKNTAVKDFDKGKEIITLWKPDKELECTIIGANIGMVVESAS